MSLSVTNRAAAHGWHATGVAILGNAAYTVLTLARAGRSFRMAVHPTTGRAFALPGQTQPAPSEVKAPAVPAVGSGLHFPTCDWVGCAGCRSTPVLRSGYAHKSTRRHPSDPSTVVVGSEEIAAARYVGTARIDGSPCHAFRAGRVYYFQTATELIGR